MNKAISSDAQTRTAGRDELMKLTKSLAETNKSIIENQKFASLIKSKVELIHPGIIVFGDMNKTEADNWRKEILNYLEPYLN